MLTEVLLPELPMVVSLEPVLLQQVQVCLVQLELLLLAALLWEGAPGQRV